MVVSVLFERELAEENVLQQRSMPHAKRSGRIAASIWILGLFKVQSDQFAKLHGLHQMQPLLVPKGTNFCKAPLGILEPGHPRISMGISCRHQRTHAYPSDATPPGSGSPGSGVQPVWSSRHLGIHANPSAAASPNSGWFTWFIVE